jgi:hypothetical protein
MQFANISRGQAEKVFIVVQEGGDQELLPGHCVEFDVTTTTADQGYKVSGCSVLASAVLAPTKPIAGIADSTISTSTVGRLQVYGPAQVRSVSSFAGGIGVAATSHDSASLGTHIATTAIGTANVHYGGGLGLIGTSIAGVNATNTIVQLRLL